MSDYGWFAVKGICYLVLIGWVCWFTQSGWPLWALFLLPSWSGGNNDDEEVATK